MRFQRWLGAAILATLVPGSSVQAGAIPVIEVEFAGQIHLGGGPSGLGLTNGILLYNNSFWHFYGYIPIALTPTADGYGYQSPLVYVPAFGTVTTEPVMEYTIGGTTTGVVLGIDPNTLQASAGHLAGGTIALAPGVSFDDAVNPSGTPTPITESAIQTELETIAQAGSLGGGLPVEVPPPPPGLVSFAQQDTGGFSPGGVGSSFGANLEAFSGEQQIGTISGSEQPPGAVPEPASLVLFASGLVGLAAVWQRQRTPTRRKANMLGPLDS